ncbi:MAG: T9SS type A sorting domain-containing protein [Candidatus Cloacimonetes bacterium]|nr:T9SS type A sorting domain-containing protein [Candidatus Cloacimonadota bacterium]
MKNKEFSLLKTIKYKYLIFFILLFTVQIFADSIVIGESSQATATERNNARLIVEDQNEILHVVYYDNGIYYSSSNDNGQSWTEPPFLITNIGRNPSIAIDNDNLLHLVYKRGGINAFDIVHRTYNGVWSEEDDVHNDAVTTVSRPVIAIDNLNNLHCVWQRHGFSSTPNSEIWYKKYSSSSGWTGLTNISSSYGASEYPTLSIDNNNNIYTFWKDSGENISNDKMVLFRKYTVDIGWDENYTNVSNTSGNGSYATMDPCSIIDSENNIHLVWKDSQTGTREIFYKKCTDGIWDDSPTNISNQTTASGRPSISIDAIDNLYVAWENKTDGVYYDVVYKKYEKETNTWSDMVNLSETDNIDSRHPICPLIKNDYLYTIWTEGENMPFSVMINSIHLVESDNIVVAQSSQSTATERNNARLIVEDQNGILHVVYYNNGIYYCSSSDNGQSWTDPPIFITEMGRNPSMALDSNNLLHLVYKKGDANANDIVHRTYNGNWSTEDDVHNDAGTTVSRPVIAIDNENNLHCVWQRHGFSSTPNSEIWYKKYSSGSGWTGLTNVSSTYGASEYPTLSIDNNNNIYTFWKDSGEVIDNDKMVLFRKYTDGIGWDENYTNVSNTTGNGDYATMDPCSIVDSENNIHLVWKDSESGTKEIYYKKCTDGIWDNSPANISNLSSTSGRPSISIDAVDNLYVVWENITDGVHYDVVYKKYEKETNTWSDMINLSETNNIDSRHPICPLIKNDYLYTIWTEGGGIPFSVMINSILIVDTNDDYIVNKVVNLLSQNYPNPFNPSTTISFETTNLIENTRIEIFNIKGQKIKTLEVKNEKLGINEVVWNGKNENGKVVSSGIYFYNLILDSKVVDSKKMILMK